MQRAAGSSPASGSAQEVHFTPVILGNAAQHERQQEAVRLRHGSSPPQATHHDGRTIRAASRPRKDSAPAIVDCTPPFYREDRQLMRLNHRYPSLIVRPMKKAAFLLAVLALAALPAAAQSSEFGFLFGGSKRLNDISGTQGSNRIAKDFTFSNSVKEAFYGVQLEPDTMFKIKVGEITAPIIALDADGNRVDAGKGNIDHIDALVDYRFSEPFGSTGLFGGLGMYRQSVKGYQDETNVGVSAGVNGDFPLSRRYGIIVEGAYHWIHLSAHPRYITLTGGLRISF
jgi:hypothetical protein